LEIAAKTLINSFGTGSHVSSLKDSIIDVDVTREYQPGDKKLDSRSSLKMSQTMSRVFTPDKSMTTMIVLDASSSQSTKINESIITSLYLAYLADNSSDAIGIVTFSDDVIELVSPSGDTRNVTDVLRRLNDSKLSGKTNLEKPLNRVAELELTNSMIVVVSDFCYDLSARTVVNLRRLAGGINNTVVASIMLNECEWEFDSLPFAVDFADSESGSMVDWSFSDQNLEAFSKFYCDWQRNLKIKLRQAKTEPIFINVNRNNFLMPLVKYFLRSQK
jgi:hypothetical protein